MHTLTKNMILASMLAYAGLSAQAQTAPAPSQDQPTARTAQHGGGHGRHGQFDPARREAHQAQRLAALKDKLQLTDGQQDAWNSFTAALKPVAHGPHPSRAEMQQLTTPQRLDKMHELRNSRAAAADQREAAVRSFYASLNATQQKTFDAEFRHMGPGPRAGHGGRGHGPRPANG